MALLKGRAAAPGIAMATARIHKIAAQKISSAKTFSGAHEKARWEKAKAAVEGELESLIKKFEATGPKESAEILNAHLLMLQDPEWSSLIDKLLMEGHQAEFAVDSASEEFARMIESLNDPYLRQRAQDIRDVKKRILDSFSGSVVPEGAALKDHILFAEDLMPSELLTLYGPQIKGIVLEKGNPTSHTTILARTFEIPLIIGAGGVLNIVRNEDPVAMDGLRGIVIVNPDPVQAGDFDARLKAEIAEHEELTQYKTQKSVLLDGKKLEVAANLNGPMDLDFALRKGCEGVGLFRTEFLLMDRTQSPTEEEQFQIYKNVVEQLTPHRAVIRTFDIGGDKQVSFLELPHEANPFLGLRGIRYCLREPEFFKVQLRALVRAAQFGNLAIMAPMVSKIEELFAFKNLLNVSREELLQRGEKITRTPEIGIMIEVPAIAFIADQLIPHLDFMSVGTNDLLQYICAADRMNSDVAELHDPYHPGVLRALKLISDAIKESKVWLGMCGEMAAQADYIPLLIALGFTELSVSPGAVLRTRKIIRHLRFADCEAKLVAALRARNSQDMKTILKSMPV